MGKQRTEFRNKLLGGALYLKGVLTVLPPRALVQLADAFADLGIWMLALLKFGQEHSTHGLSVMLG